MSLVFPRTGVHESKKTLPRSSSDIILIISYPEELCNEELYCQQIRNVDRMKRIELRCCVR